MSRLIMTFVGTVSLQFDCSAVPGALQITHHSYPQTLVFIGLPVVLCARVVLGMGS
jgi:hypothetical protein